MIASYKHARRWWDVSTQPPLDQPPQQDLLRYFAHIFPSSKTHTTPSSRRTFPPKLNSFPLNSNPCNHCSDCSLMHMPQREHPLSSWFSLYCCFCLVGGCSTRSHKRASKRAKQVCSAVQVPELSRYLLKLSSLCLPPNTSQTSTSQLRLIIRSVK